MRSSSQPEAARSQIKVQPRLTAGTESQRPSRATGTKPDPEVDGGRVALATYPGSPRQIAAQPGLSMNSAEATNLSLYLDELSFLLGSAIPGLQLVVRGDLSVEFDLAAEATAVSDLLHRYRDRRMDLADACLVRMTERQSRCKVWTVDRDDFQVYRRHRRQPVPCEFPPERD